MTRISRIWRVGGSVTGAEPQLHGEVTNRLTMIIKRRERANGRFSAV
jgi:hypothetical protein